MMWLVTVTPVVLVLLGLGAAILVVVKRNKKPVTTVKCELLFMAENVRLIRRPDLDDFIVHVRSCSLCYGLLQRRIESVQGWMEDLAMVWNHLTEADIVLLRGLNYKPDQQEAEFDIERHLRMCEQCQERYWSRVISEVE